MSKGADKSPKSIVDDLADEYRSDALRRLDEMSTALKRLADNASSSNLNDDEWEENLTVLKSHAHSIKGTSGTFGFAGLSIIAHVTDDYLQQNTLEAHPGFLIDIERLQKLMKTVISANTMVSEETARDLLKEFSLEPDPAGHEKNATGLPSALLIMEHGGIHETIVRTLEILGLNVLCARDGVEAIEIATISHPDIVLTALHSDRLDGPELIQVLAEINATSSIPSIVLVPENSADFTVDFDKARDQLISRLPSDVHVINQDEHLSRALGETLIALNIIAA